MNDKSILLIIVIICVLLWLYSLKDHTKKSSSYINIGLTDPYFYSGDPNQGEVDQGMQEIVANGLNGGGYGGRQDDGVTFGPTGPSLWF